MMKCPYCGSEMEKGYIDQTRIGFPLEWYPANRETWIFDNGKKNIKLTSFLKGYHVIAYQCAKCRKFIIDEDRPH